jgi:hypothetical protein
VPLGVAVHSVEGDQWCAPCAAQAGHLATHVYENVQTVGETIECDGCGGVAHATCAVAVKTSKAVRTYLETFSEEVMTMAHHRSRIMYGTCDVH